MFIIREDSWEFAVKKCEEYLKNLYPKLKKGSECFIMIADPDKYIDQNGQYKLMTSAGFVDWGLFVDDYDGDPVAGRWYFYGIDRFCALLNKYNYNLLSKDVIGKYDIRSPIIHFTK